MHGRILCIIIFFALATLSGFRTFSQDRCGTDEYVKKTQQQGGESPAIFEQWIERNIRSKLQSTGSNLRTRSNPYKIPVVIHIIHNGENDPSNISDAQIMSQLRVLNDDFNRRNADASNTPAIFQPVAGSLDIEFILAKRTPEGLPTTGIVRTQGPKNQWKIADDFQLKGVSYWPAEDYFNIWVCNLDDRDILGYSTFPSSNLVGGLQSGSNRLTDGVVISYKAFGSKDDGNFNLVAKYDKGRTATHEVGHFFGLRHIWGDDDGACGGNGDYVDDTPDQGNRTFNCPSHPRTSCGGIVSMFQNFLDFTDDACMNIITQGQVQRMSIILENSPRRKSLLTSPGLEEPQPLPNDLGIQAIVSPKPGECAGTLAPVIAVTNYGINNVTSARLEFRRNNIVIEDRVFDMSLAPGETTQLVFNPMTFLEGTTNLSFTIVQTNGGADGNPLNNQRQRSTEVSQPVEAPFLETFTTLPSNWQIVNFDNARSWELVDAINKAPDNKAMKMDFFAYEDSEGEVDVLMSPPIDLSDASIGLLLFDVAYAQFNASRLDGLRVVVLTDCNTDISQGAMVFDKSGGALATAATTTQAFTPSSARDWRTETVNLSAYIGQPGVRLAFIGVNDYGNNLFLDNVRLLTEDFSNVSLTSILNPPPAVCLGTVTPRILVRNSGTQLSSLQVQYTVNGATALHQVSNLNLNAGSETPIQLPAISLSPGLNQLNVVLLNPNNEEDLDPTDNSLSKTILFEQKNTVFPFRETFERPFEQRWTTVSPGAGMNWTTESFPNNIALKFAAFGNTSVGDEAWLVTPVFSLKDQTAASLFFDYAYARRGAASEVFTVMASTSCNGPFDRVLKVYSGTELTEITSASSWKPSSEDDWNRKVFLNLQPLIGRDEVRIAFVITNRNGNNFYLDNISFYESNEPTQVDVEGTFNVYPNPLRSGELLQISFNFEELEEIAFEVTDLRGRTVIATRSVSVLNHTYNIPTDDLVNGLYVIRVISRTRTYHTKFIIDR